MEEEDDDVLLKPEDRTGKIPIQNRAMEVVLTILTIALFVSFFLIVVVF
ncbi:MAG TPA: hypothetical protein VK508_21925 [Cyclobacteriaceae bacterium]|nr:hypothetical protein [Cyclobacteriaceae bacterium]